MPDFDYKEKRFEEDIEEYLTTKGAYIKGDPKAFDRSLALDVNTFVSFIKTSQPKAWERYEKIYGADSEKQIVDRFCREVKMVGLLKVFRQGFTDRGIKFRAVFWKPETTINPTTLAQYNANILHCTRQLRYSLHNENSIDIVLFINGIPVVSMELKCQFTGQNKLLDELAAQGIHENLSFFAFTATPKDKTLQMFGTRDENGKYHPFHIYSMRQAIEEHFILDVLQNYMTYNMFYKIAKNIPDDPELDTTAGVKAIRNYETLHPHNISQKTAIMLEHFRNITRHKIGGKAKAMIVTPSRLHAVRYVLEFKKQIEEKGYTDLDVLVAFSGEVTDGGETYTEEKINKTKDGETVKENALPAIFHTDDFGMLIVAEKYQTGFDEPLLHTMFVDKKLSGVKAVQTLSRLNRTCRGKQDTFVLDFVNSAEDIKKAFEPYYEETVLEKETDPNVVYDLKNTLDGYRVYQQIEINGFADVWYSAKSQEYADLGKLKAKIQPALDRYNALEAEKQDMFKSTLARFNRIYSFITQVCRLFDKEIHKFSIYAKFLSKMLPKGGNEKIYIDDKVLLEYYKLEKDFDGSIQLEPTEEGFTPIAGEAGRREKKKDPLTVIIDKINDKYGTEFTEMDKVLLQIENDYASQDKWKSYAKSNDFKTFMLLFEKDFPTMAAARYEQNEDFFVKLFSDPEMMKWVMDSIGSVIFERLKK